MSDEISKLRKELESLVYSVSHDLRAPLRIIDGFSEALAEDYRDKLDDTARDYLARIREAAGAMESRINALLELSRISGAELRRESVDITQAATAIASKLKTSNPARSVEFAIAPRLAVNGDPALWTIALDHLLGNAWKFTSKHPAAKIEVGSEQRDGRRLLFVRDDGAGFDPAYASRMFTPFQRFHPESEFEGVGIGLALVQRIVSRHGGNVWASGKIEHGATVYIDLE